MKPKLKTLLLCFVWVSLTIGPGSELAAQGLGPENTLVVINADSKDSIAVGHHFAHLRNIPSCNIVYLDRIPKGRQCELAQFKERILEPLLEVIQQREINSQVECITYSSGFPTTVRAREHLEILKTLVDAERLDKRIYNPTCSITGLTYFYTMVAADNPGYLALDANWYMRLPANDVLENPFRDPLQQEFTDALGKLKAGDSQSAVRTLSKIVSDNPAQTSVRYQLVRALVANDQPREALQQLNTCVNTGWSHRTYTTEDESLKALRSDPYADSFQQVLQKMQDYPYGQAPSRGFSNRIAWAPNAAVNNLSGQGRRYVLSTMLAVVQPDGTNASTLEQAIQQISRSVSADGTQPEGEFFFTNTNDVRSKTRKARFPAVIQQLQDLGFKASEVRGHWPKTAPQVIGATLGRAKVDWAGSNSQFQPGALSDNLTSFGGVIPGKHNQTRLTTFLNAGAAGASGTVVEPYALQAKFPLPDLHVHYVRGCTLAESFYQSVYGPFQLLVVGDPLCRPFGRTPQFSVVGLTDDQLVTEDLSVSIQPDEESVGIAGFDIYIDGRKKVTVAANQKADIPFNELTDGYHELRCVAIDNTLIATRTSQSIPFRVDRQGKTFKLAVAGSGTYQIERTVTLKIRSDFEKPVEIWRHHEKVAELKQGSNELRVDGSKLGPGHSILRAVIRQDDGFIFSNSVDVEIKSSK